MKTISFIGSDKNAGKTTALNYWYQQLRKKQEGKICLTSIGINGEASDAYEGKAKPTIRINKDTWFVSSENQLSSLNGFFSIKKTFQGKEFSKLYVLGEALSDFDIVLEGPNDRNGILSLKNAIEKIQHNTVCLIDGSIDRQFLGQPAISDGICFAVLISDRLEQQNIVEDYLKAIQLPTCSLLLKENVLKNLSESSKSILMDHHHNVKYISKNIPFLDQSLIETLISSKDEQLFLYLNGSLSKSLIKSLGSFRNLTIILDNFTCYQNISTKSEIDDYFKPVLQVLHKVPILAFFLKQDNQSIPFSLPSSVPIYNLFRDTPHEIGI